jgi:hypothetical protein
LLFVNGLFGADKNFEVELDVVHSYANINGLIPLVATKVKVENGTLSVTKLVLVQPFVDARDFADKLIKAELSIHPPGVKITTPTIPCGFRETTEVKAMFARDVNHCDEEDKAHKVLCTSLESNHALTTRETLYTFPDDLMCTNTYFNERVPDPLRLVSKIETTWRVIKEEQVPNPRDMGGEEIFVRTVEFTLAAKWELFVVGSEQGVESSRFGR